MISGGVGSCPAIWSAGENAGMVRKQPKNMWSPKGGEPDDDHMFMEAKKQMKGLKKHNLHASLEPHEDCVLL